MININNFGGYKVKDLVRWDFFKSVDVVIQKSFITTLCNEFNANTNVLSDMFRVNYQVVDLYFKKQNIKPFTGLSRDEVKNKKWKDFIRALNIERNKNKLDALTNQIVHGELTFQGLANDILESIAKLCNGKQVTINVKW